MKFTILLKLTAFAMLATSSSVYASEDHAVQHSLRGSSASDEDSADQELYGWRDNGTPWSVRPNGTPWSVRSDGSPWWNGNNGNGGNKAPQGSVPCIRSGGSLSCPNNDMDMTYDGSGCTCTPSSARNPRKPAGFIPGPGPRPRPQRGSGQCDVVTNAISRGIGCLSVGDDQSTCEACGCRYVAFVGMCKQ